MENEAGYIERDPTKPMRLLHLGCHEVLEYDELRLFTKIPGLEVFSPGAYINPRGIGGRPPIPELKVKQEWLDAWGAVPHNPNLDPPLSDQKANLTQDILGMFDAVMIHHVFGWVSNNWDAFEKWGGKVFYRDIGQTTLDEELILQSYRDKGMKIIRYSPASERIRNYAGADHMIRFSKDPGDFLPWVGDRSEVMTIGQSMKARGGHCGYDLFIDSTRNLTRRLYGNDNQASGPIWSGKLSYQQIIERLSWTRCYFYTGTHPAPYTLNFMEAALAGCPIVAPTNEAQMIPFDQYEAVEILESFGLEDWAGKNTHYLEDRCIKTLSSSDQDLRERSDAQRAGAAAIFGYDVVIPMWKEAFGLK